MGRLRDDLGANGLSEDYAADDFFDDRYHLESHRAEVRPDPPPKLRPPRAVILRQRRRRRRIIVVTTAILSVYLLMVGSACAYMRTRLDRIGRLSVAGLVPDRPGEALNTLVVGSDGGETRVIMVLQARRASASVVFVPAEPGGDGGQPAESLAALSLRGGPSALVAAVGSRLGIPINHYIELSVDKLAVIVDTLGGVAVTAGTPSSDDAARRCTRLDGSRAAELLRMESDAAVARRQADLVAGVAAGALQGPVGGLKRFGRLLSEGIDGVLFDTGLSSRDLTFIGDAFDSERVTLSLPATSSPTPAATALPEPEDIRVRVLNATRVDGAAARAATALRAAGFAIAGTGSAGYPAFATIVHFTPGQRVKAEVLASRLVTAGIGEERPGGAGDEEPADVILVVGEDYAGLRTGAPAEITLDTVAEAPAPASVRRTCR